MKEHYSKCTVGNEVGTRKQEGEHDGECPDLSTSHNQDVSIPIMHHHQDQQPRSEKEKPYQLFPQHCHSAVQ